MADAQPDTQNWASVSLGIVTTATILAAATSAGIFAVSSGLFGSAKGGYPEGFRTAAALLPVASLISYWGALFFGLIAAFRRTQASQKGEVLKAVILIYVQAGTAVSAVLLIIFARLF